MSFKSKEEKKEKKRKKNRKKVSKKSEMKKEKKDRTQGGFFQIMYRLISRMYCILSSVRNSNSYFIIVRHLHIIRVILPTCRKC